MSVLFIFVVLMSSSLITATKANRLGRIENKLNILDLKLNANSMEITALKTDMTDTNRKLDVLIELLNGTQTAHHADDTKDTLTADNLASQRPSTPRILERTIRGEVSRVRRAFAAEKKKLSLQQEQNQAQFLEFAKQLDSSLTRLDNVHKTKWTLTSSSINESVTSVLNNVQDEIGFKLIEWNQTVHDYVNEMNDKMHSRLETMDKSILSWNDDIQRTLTEVSNTIVSSTNTSANRLDQLTNNMKTTVMSSLSKINATVDAMNYADELSTIATNLKLHDDKTENSFNKLKEGIQKSLTEESNTVLRSIETSMNRHDNKRENSINKLHQKLGTISFSIQKLQHNIPTWLSVDPSRFIRLVGGSSWKEGRLEVKVDGKWGTICYFGFGNTDATVACRMLGFESGVFKYRAFGQGTGDILMTTVGCTGTERFIQDCFYRKPHDCKHNEDVGVICS